MVAADWDVLPQGTRIWIEGYGEAVVEDTGGMIKGNRLDIYMERHQEALKWGRKMVRVRLLGGDEQ